MQFYGMPPEGVDFTGLLVWDVCTVLHNVGTQDVMLHE